MMSKPRKKHVEDDKSYIEGKGAIFSDTKVNRSPYTAEDLKCYKRLEAYNQMVYGWVREAHHQLIVDMCVVKARVLHFQRIRENPQEPWVSAEKSERSPLY